MSYSRAALQALHAGDIRRLARAASWSSKADRVLVAELLGLGSRTDVNPKMMANIGQKLAEPISRISREDAMQLARILSGPVYEARDRHGLAGDRVDLASIEAGIEGLLEDFNVDDVRLYLAHFADISVDEGASDGSYEERLARRCRVLLHRERLTLEAWLEWDIPQVSPEDEALDAALPEVDAGWDGALVDESVAGEGQDLYSSEGEQIASWRSRAAELEVLRRSVANAAEETTRLLQNGAVPGPEFEELRGRLAGSTAALVADVHSFLEREGLTGVDLEAPGGVSRVIDEVETALRERDAARTQVEDLGEQGLREVNRLAKVQSAIPPLEGFTPSVQDVIRSAVEGLHRRDVWSDEDFQVLEMLRRVGEVHVAALSSDTATALRIAGEAPAASPFIPALYEAAETHRWAPDSIVEEDGFTESTAPSHDKEPVTLEERVTVRGAPVVERPQVPLTAPVVQASPSEAADDSEPDAGRLSNESTVATCIRAGEMGLAHWVARASNWPAVKHRVLSAAAYASAIESENDEIASGYERAISGFKIHGLEDNRGLQLLAFSAAVRVTLFAPYRGALDVLNELERSLGDPAASRLVTELRRNIGVQLMGAASGTGGASLEQLEEKITQVVAEVLNARATWVEQRTFLPRANRVWRRCLGDKEPLGELARSVQLDARESVEAVDKLLKEMRENTDGIIDALDAGPRGTIEGEPRAWLHRHFNNVFELVERWVAAVREYHGRLNLPEDGLDARVQSLRTSLRELRDPVLSWLDGEYQRADDDGRELRSAGIAAASQLFSETLQVALDGGGNGGRVGHALDPLQRPMLRAIQVPFSEFVRRAESDEVDGWLTADQVAAALKTPLRQAIEARTAANEFRAAQLLLDELVEAREDEADIDRLQTSLEDRIVEADRTLESQLEACERSLSRARQQQHFALHDASQQRFEEQFRKLRSDVRNLVDSRDHAVGFSEIASFELKLSEELERSRSVLYAELARAVEGVPAIKAEEDRIRAAIDAGDLETARELMRLAEEGKSLPLESQGSEEGFARIRDLLEKVLPVFERQQPAADGLLRAIGEQREASEGLPIDFSRVSEQFKGVALGGIEAWFKLVSARVVGAGVRAPDVELDEQIRRILAMLGITLRQQDLRQDRGGGGEWYQWFTVEQARVSGAVTAHQFGSSSKGRYAVLLVTAPAEPQVILDQIKEHDGDSPVIVLFLGVISRDQRQRLANHSRRQLLRPAAFVDLAAAALLAAGSGRLHDTLSLTLPFSWLEPYNPHANAFVPEEVFAGRDAELQAITDQGTTHFIYGGRQLGKSALLKAAQRKFDSEYRKSVYIDTKAFHIGSLYGASHIIKVVTEHLADASIPIVADPVLDPAQVLRRSVIAWLDENEERRLLILLDEVDDLLDEDAPRFETVNYFKALYQQTNQRAKPIFAGLHSVQRFLSHSNNPFPHLGRHREIGPLATSPATDLVTGPLASLGLRFESLDLVARFLRQTNYHPGLIQIYCEALVKHMARKPIKVDEPPQLITSDDVYGVFVDPDVTSLVRERFSLTIGLDDRYRVIAYALARRALNEPMVDGMTIDALLEDCARFWPNGFPRRERTEFEVLLREMVGLGVLSVDASRRYLFRSPNVVELLGDGDEINQVLDSAKEKRRGIGYDLAVFRSLHKVNGVDRRVPLSEEAMRGIIGVGQEKSRFWVIFGSLATSSDIILDAIQKSAVRHDLRPPKKRSLAALEKGIAKSQGADAVTQFLVPMDSEAADEVRAHVDRIRELVETNRNISVAVLVGPRAIEAWTDLRRADADHGSPAVVQLSRMSDASIQAWGRHIDRPLNNERAVRAVREATGGWPVLIDELYRQSMDEMPWSEALQATASRYTEPVDAAEFIAMIGLIRDSIHGHLFDQIVQLGENFSIEELVDYFTSEPRFAGHDVLELLDDLIALQVLDERSSEDMAAGSEVRRILTPEPRCKAAWVVAP